MVIQDTSTHQTERKLPILRWRKKKRSPRHETAIRSWTCLILLLDTQIALLLTLLASKRASP